MYSAKKVNGRHLYSLARENIEVERKPIDIVIYEIELLKFSNDTLVFRTVCSTGTYIRSLVKDVAEKLNNYATMTALTRTKIDKFSLNQAYTLADLAAGNYELISTYDLLSDYSYVELKDPTRVYQGKKLKLDGRQEKVIMITFQGNVIAAYEKNEEDGLYYSKRGLW